MKILAIDDSEVDVKGLRDYCKVKGWNYTWKTFDEDYYKFIFEENPDVVVLDWYDDADKTDGKGEQILDCIWKTGYRPIIIFSAHADAINLSDKMKRSSLLKLLIKEDEAIINCLEENALYYDALSSYRNEMSDVIIEAFNAIDSIKRVASNDISVELVKHLVAKRAINAFDLETKEIDIPAWGMYVVPPVSKVLQRGDVIRKFKTGEDYKTVGEAGDYLLVLTPSCDLAHAKVKKVICAPCEDESAIQTAISNEFCKIYNHKKGTEEQKQLVNDYIKKRLIGVLNQGYYQQWAALPEMEGICKNMSVNLKNIDLIDLDKIATNIETATETTEYVRVASIDSPYVSQIAWGFMQNVCRPGAPDRDVENWVNAIFIEQKE